jgi:hypothetical protein
MRICDAALPNPTQPGASQRETSPAAVGAGPVRRLLSAMVLGLALTTTANAGAGWYLMAPRYPNHWRQNDVFDSAKDCEADLMTKMAYRDRAKEHCLKNGPEDSCCAWVTDLASMFERGVCVASDDPRLGGPLQ